MKPSHPMTTLLGGMTPTAFLRDYWQKKPLLIRQAIPGFSGFVSKSELRSLAQDDEVQSRLIVREGKQWELQQGPFSKTVWRGLPTQSQWTLLVQELNFHIPEAEQLLQQFRFIPHARVDDIMVSHASTGGGVGPHVDSYDVFLLQGPGRRRWRISGQKDLSLIPGLPLKILKSFKHEQEWVLEPGDMLYLPPNYAHEGVAVEECFTYSIGFRAPSAREWLAEFLSDYAERLECPGHYNDPRLQATSHPGQLPKAMTTYLAQELKNLKFKASTLVDFNGRFLTEPKPHVFFNPPEAPLSLQQFKKEAKHHGIQLDPRTRFLYADQYAWCNGEALCVLNELQGAVIDLADQRYLDPKNINHIEKNCSDSAIRKQLWDWWYDWYQDGWLKIDAQGLVALQ